MRRLLLEAKFIGTRRCLEVLGLACSFGFGFLAAWIGMQYQGLPEVVTPLSHSRHLAAEMLAQGRVGMPPVPGGYFLQTYLTLQSPVYAAAIPLGEAVPIAIGYRLGDPLLGGWLMAGVLCLSVAWMIRGFASLRWAILGSGFCAVWMCTFGYWAQSYDGYAATACGIALMWGAARRYAFNPLRRYAFIVGLSLGWIGFCLPVALLFSAPVPILIWFNGLRRSQWRGQGCVLLLAGAALFAAAQGVVNINVTGDFFVTPQSAYEAKYDNNPFFLWELKRVSPEFDFLRMEQYDLLVAETRSILPAPAGREWGTRLADSLRFYVGYPVALLVLGTIFTGVARWTRWVLGAVGFSLAAVILVLPYELSYSVALGVLVPLLFVISLRKLIHLRRGRLLGIRAVAFVGGLVFVVAWARGTGKATIPEVMRHVAYKDELSRYLVEEEGGRHVVVVNYDFNVNSHVEYVYNTANLDSQPVVWARWNSKMGEGSFYDYFKDRKIWALWVAPARMPELRRFHREAIKPSGETDKPPGETDT